jgi:hypothetical protein
MLVGWGILSPLSKLSGWAPGPTGDMTDGARGWILWTSLATMCADSVVSLLPIVYEYFVDGFWRRELQDHKDDGLEKETPDRLVPSSWVVSGLAISVSFGTIIVWGVFGNEGIKAWATIIGFAIGGMLSIFGYVYLLPSTHFSASCNLQSTCPRRN